MLENEAIGIGTILKVIIGPLLLAAGLAYGMYRYRHGRAGTTRQTTPAYFTGTVIAVLAVGTIFVVGASLMVSRDMDRKAATTGSSTRPYDPGSNVDRAPTGTPRQDPLNETNVPPAGRSN
ncbi:MAG: hypothetical protein QOG83_95 [Alphaproteobacteria bacterium]|nr:hypothetical protein [Alphaproteobacteria bacterium]